MKKELATSYDPSLYEDDIYKKWEEAGAFNPDTSTPDGATESYTISMPPPNVTGVLHMGHAGMLAYQDVLTRFNRMKGKKTLWLPGTDHASIATQTKVEKIIKEEGTNRHELGNEKFLERVRDFAQGSHDTIAGQIRKMGSSCDWSREAYTLDETRSKAVRSVFTMMHDEDLIYRGERVVNWCPRCTSTLADDEVEHKDQKANFYTFKYDKNFPIAIATTRPETKLGDTAVAVNPKDERYKQYIGQVFEVDFCGIKLNIKVIGDRHVDMDFGTGALGVTPAHSAADWQMMEDHGLEVIKVIDENGVIKEGFNEFSGLSAKEARKKIAAELEARGLVEKTEEIDNALSICYRCDTPIEPLPSLQWFMNVNKPIERLGNKTIKELSVEAVRTGVFGRDKINIIPDRFEKTYFHWMENLKDWCISRQILFGHQIPVWYKGKEIYVGETAPEGDDWIQDTDTLDTWFSSGTWTFSTLANNPGQITIKDGKLNIDTEDFKNFHPTSVLETGYDIIFFWVARMIIMTTYAVEDIPFQDVYLHGLVLDGKGKKMSKSKGNTMDPLDMIPKYGTDATRLSLLIGSAPGADMKLSEEKIEGFRNFINKLWNISRFIVSNLETDLAELNKQQINPDNLTSADKWILKKMQTLIGDVTIGIDEYKFSSTGESLRDFAWNDLADWYLEASKFEKTSEKEIILFTLLKDLLKMLHPFTPFITETIWAELETDTLLITTEWPIADYYNNFTTGDTEEFETVINVIKAIRNARSENKVEPARKVEAVIYAGDKVEFIKTQLPIIQKLKTGIKTVTVSDKGDKIEKAILAVENGLEIYLLGAIDEEKEKLRIQKEIENLQKMITGTEGKLSNEAFVNNAPEFVINQQKETLAQNKEKLQGLQEALKNL